MIRIVPGFSPEIPRRAYDISDEVERELNSLVPEHLTRAARFDEIVLNIIAVNPVRGVIPGGTKLMRSRKELWSAWNMDFHKFEKANADQMRSEMRSGALNALRAIEEIYIPNSTMAEIISLVGA
jgi:hypothetical protein